MKDTEEVEDVRDMEDTEEVEDVKDMEEREGVEDVKDMGGTEEVEDVREVEDTEDPLDRSEEYVCIELTSELLLALSPPRGQDFRTCCCRRFTQGRWMVFCTG